jgi:ADP-heptose:LPS heptosyltransferase
MQRGSVKNRILDYWIGTPVLNLLASVHPRRKPPADLTQLRRVGVMCAPALGDTLLFSGPLQDLRAALPAAHITHICMKQNLAAAEIIPGADARLLIDVTRPWEAIPRLRAQRFDVLLDFTVWQRLTALLTLCSRSGYTAGFDTPGQHRSRAYDRSVEHRRDRHELENHRALLAGCGLPLPPAQPHEPAVLLEAPAIRPFPDEPNLVVFHLWASGQRSWLREWPEERWTELAQRLTTQLEAPLFIITGGPADRERSEAFAARLRTAGLRAQPFVSPDGFRSLTDILRRARLLVSVNTGVMHLGAVAGAPTISLNGPTAEHRWGARGRCVANVQPADGSGGYLHLGFEFDGQDETVMQRIAVDQVAEACASLLQQCTPREHSLAAEAL